MLRLLLLFMLLVHSLIHVLGFVKAFGLGAVAQLSKDISKPMGLFWLLAAALFLLVFVFILLKKDWWPLGLVAVVLSQILIFSSWQDARFGSIANVVILLATILAWGAWRFEKSYQTDVKTALERSNAGSDELLTESDIQDLPAPVQRYLRYAGVLNKPKVKNMRIVFTGQMRDKGKDWFPFRSEQYNCFDEPTRLFFMKGKMYGMTVPGYHAYKNGVATMQIKVYGLFPVVNIKGDVLNKAETVTVFNDMCLLAPASLIDKSIQWEAIDSTSAKAVFSSNGISISAILYFNPEGQLINFTSDDRSALDMQQYRFSTPVHGYKDFHGYKLMERGDAVWHYPDGEFVYGKFFLQEIEYNVPALKKGN
ncbi:MAG: hypothetical protein IPO07_11670 [Haliscomenobacter sp.]|nr:DUF6544 family protein [Haliscomenobacter sp.]MBK9489366.1 hypothetical protein [Haliscomenobacter sp.]